MGPHSFKCGKLTIRLPPGGRPPSFNGAALFQVRKGWTKIPARARNLGFNGAALFQVRKANQQDIAMGLKTRLQWGRTLSSAERIQRHPQSHGIHRLQWGRTLSSAERNSARLMELPASNGFNGAALFQVRKVKRGFPN